MFTVDDPTHELAAVWGVKEQLRRLLHTVEQTRHQKMIMGCHVVAADMAETRRLWNTLCTWWPAVEVPITTGVSNARTETANTAVKQIKRTGRGYKNSSHHQARILLRSTARRAA